MEKQKLTNLFGRFLDDKLTPGEIRTLFNQLDQLGEEHNLGETRQLIHDKVRTLENQLLTEDPGLQEVYDRVYRKILAATGEDARDPAQATAPAETAARDKKIITLPVKRKIWLRIAAAVSLLILVGSGSYFLFLKKLSPPRQHQPQQEMQTNTDIRPGSNRAVLTLSNGSKILLYEAETGKLADQNGIQVSKTSDGTIVYDASYAGQDRSPASYNTIKTPRGGQYQVVLPDGTKVWLNAASTLRYPTGFSGKERKVELAGEAYFEVARDDSKPFRVNTLDQVIEVLGTHFNVSAYTDETETRTTLLEGSVKIIAGNNTDLLKPGQQATVVSSSSRIAIRSHVNTDAAVAWKNGKFIFEGERIESIMKKIGRWYNAEIIYQGVATEQEFIGTVSRFENVSEVLNLLELTGAVRFKIVTPASGSSEKQIIVMPGSP